MIDMFNDVFSSQAGRKSFSKKRRKEIWSNSVKMKLLKLVDDELEFGRAHDVCGNEVIYGSHGQEGSKFGWNIHHIDYNRRNNDNDNLQAISFACHKGKH